MCVADDDESWHTEADRIVPKAYPLAELVDGAKRDAAIGFGMADEGVANGIEPTDFSPLNCLLNDFDVVQIGGETFEDWPFEQPLGFVRRQLGVEVLTFAFFVVAAENDDAWEEAAKPFEEDAGGAKLFADRDLFILREAGEGIQIEEVAANDESVDVVAHGSNRFRDGFLIVERDVKVGDDQDAMEGTPTRGRSRRVGFFGDGKPVAECRPVFLVAASRAGVEEVPFAATTREEASGQEGIDVSVGGGPGDTGGLEGFDHFALSRPLALWPRDQDLVGLFCFLSHQGTQLIRRKRRSGGSYSM